MDKELVMYLSNDDLQDMSGGSEKILTQVDSIEEANKIVTIIRMIKPQYRYEIYRLYLYPSSKKPEDVLKYGYIIARMHQEDEKFKQVKNLFCIKEE